MYLYLVFVVGYKLRPSVPMNSVTICLLPYQGRIQKNCLSARTRWGSFSAPDPLAGDRRKGREGREGKEGDGKGKKEMRGGRGEKCIVRMRIMATALYRIKRYRQHTVVRVRVVLMPDFLL